MHSPLARILGALAMLALFYATLRPAAPPVLPRARTAVDVEALLQASRDAFAAERYEEALAPTETLVERYPTQHVYMERLAAIYHRLNRYQEEAETWHRFMERSPTPWDACPAVADAHQAAGDARAATAAFEKCWDIEPWNPEAAFFLGRSREREGRLDEAASLYRAALAIDLRNVDSELGLARVRLHRNEFDAARKVALAVAERDPKNADALIIVALAAQRGDDPTTARTYFERTLQVAERYADAHIGLGILEFGQQRLAQSRQHFERVLDLDPSRRSEIAGWLERTGSTR